MDKLAPSEQQLLEKIRQLPKEKVIEVENFIDVLVHQNQSASQQATWDQAIAQMANDPDIQAEIAAIDAEFAIAELEGLEDS
ncbi:MAG: DUF2281 domain-containing protein [Plectolyngbya sp. WJT66-NPBG17]|jgi:hypothetical protein|nr:DUF2281 domain-containing protein [Plectolyngbya sp. WJT66-NPBG17]MBW4527851.1 DUF2281 domain-containing protein [Phormidium tanganyikae FI6-MK23]